MQGVPIKTDNHTPKVFAQAGMEGEDFHTSAYKK